MHNDWLFERFPETSQIGNLAMLSTVITFLFSFGVNILAALLSGWPHKKMKDAPVWVFAARLTVHIGSFAVLVIVSCVMYAKIIWSKSKVSAESIVASKQRAATDASLASAFGDVYVGESVGVESVDEFRHWRGHRRRRRRKMVSFNQVDVSVVHVQVIFTLILCNFDD